jgi:hypothetical protein
MKLTSCLVPFLACVALACISCERKTVVVVEPPASDPLARTKTFETAALKGAIDAYEREPSAERSADVRKRFAELDGEIAELEGRVARKDGDERAEAAQKLANLIAYRNAETARFSKAQTTTSPAFRVDGRSGAEKVEDAARRTGGALKDAAKEAGNAIKDAVR